MFFHKDQWNKDWVTETSETEEVHLCARVLKQRSLLLLPAFTVQKTFRVPLRFRLNYHSSSFSQFQLIWDWVSEFLASKRNKPGPPVRTITGPVGIRKIPFPWMSISSCKCGARKPSEEEISCYHRIKWASGDPSFSPDQVSGIRIGFVGRVGGRASGRPCSSCSKKQQQRTGTDLDSFYIWCRRSTTIVLQEWEETVSCRVWCHEVSLAMPVGFNQDFNINPQFRTMAAVMMAIPPKMETTDSTMAFRPKRRAPSTLPCCRLFRDITEKVRATMFTGHIGQKQDRIARIR